MFRLIVCLLGLVVANCATARPVTKDTQMGAMEAGDYTALIEGCGNQLVPGYTYCRKLEGSVADENLYFVVPITRCARTDFCASFKVYLPSGEPAYGASIPKGESRAEVPWKTILGRDTFQVGDRGFWLYTYEIHYTGTDFKDYVIYSEGEIRMRVVKQGYTALQNIEDDPNFTLFLHNKKTGVDVKMTSTARTYVSKQ